MRISGAFVLGAIMGAAVVWLWGREMEAYLEERTRGVRTKVAEGVRTVEEMAGLLSAMQDAITMTVWGHRL